jgi:hypothetical protein
MPDAVGVLSIMSRHAYLGSDDVTIELLCTVNGMVLLGILSRTS